MPGQTYRQETLTETETKIPGLDAGTQKSRITQSIDIAATTEPGTNHTLADVRVVAIKGTVDLGGETQSFDSAAPGKALPFLQQTFGALMGKSFTMVYARDGNFLEARAPTSATSTPLGSTQAMDGAQLAKAYRLSQELVLPKQPVAVGDTWSFGEKLEMLPIGMLSMQAKVRYESTVPMEGRNHARLTLEGTLETPVGANQLMQLAGGSSVRGEILFDLERQSVTSSTITLDVKLTVGGREASMRQTATTKLTAGNAAK
ncbi:MAG: hypothetical protein ACOYOF_09225 [Verrucomicrobiaceae bacterium]